MEATQQIILTILSYCVWIVGGLAILVLLGMISYCLIWVYCKCFGNVHKQFLSFLYWKYHSKNFGIQKEYYTFLDNEKEIMEYLKTLDPKDK